MTLIGFMIGLTLYVICISIVGWLTINDYRETNWLTFVCTTITIVGIPTVIGFWLEFFL